MTKATYRSVYFGLWFQTARVYSGAKAQLQEEELRAHMLNHKHRVRGSFETSKPAPAPT